MLEKPLRDVLRTTENHLKKLDKMGMRTVQDLLEYFPRTLEEGQLRTKFEEIFLGEKNTLKGELIHFKQETTKFKKKIGKGVFRLEDRVELEVVWFQIPYQLKSLRGPKKCFLVGKVSKNYGKFQVQNPEIHFKEGVHTGAIRPVYMESVPITSKWLREKIRDILSYAEFFPEVLPEKICEEEKLIPKVAAIKAMHFPQSEMQWKAAKRRLGFEEVFLLQVAVMQQKMHREKGRENLFPVKFEAEKVKEDLGKLPFELTTAQKRALAETLMDLEKDFPMHRLMQGDVGSGKTVVAFMACLQAVRAGFQAAILAPTEILAQQHFVGAQKFLGKFEEFLDEDLFNLNPSPSLSLGERNSVQGTGPSALDNLSSADLEHYVPSAELQYFAKQLRQGQTSAEKFLWDFLRGSRLAGFKFRRQHPLGGYVLDFFCYEKKLGIELDGEVHEDTDQKKWDEERDKFFMDNSVKILRFKNEELFETPEKVLEEIFNELVTPLPEGEVGRGVNDKGDLGDFSEVESEACFPPEDSSKIALLTGSTTQKQKKIIKQKLKAGEIKLLIGTHAILTEDTIFKNLALGVVDEQHRFGVKQRAMLEEGGAHVLAMTATPIPRSLALTVYGDQDLSIIDEKPAGRREIITRVVADTKTRNLCEKFVDDQMEKGRQIFWVCPLVEESENLNAKNVQEEYVRISEHIFPHRRVEFLHGKMRPKEKDATMERFKNHEFDILVSTSVIEVGVDVPNSTVMVIENSERFGLAQLHQFRGRVGRNDLQSYCFLMTGKIEDKNKERLMAMERSNDGFYLSEIDMKLRGSGDVYGVRQSGLPEFKCADLGDSVLMKSARDQARLILEEDFSLKNYPVLREALVHREVYF